jgi:hypothetical protein
VCEWTHHLSYMPWFNSSFLRPTKAIVENILTTKKFRVNLYTAYQKIPASITGGYGGRYFNKIDVLKELDFQFNKKIR